MIQEITTAFVADLKTLSAALEMQSPLRTEKPEHPPSHAETKSFDFPSTVKRERSGGESEGTELILFHDEDPGSNSDDGIIIFSDEECDDDGGNDAPSKGYPLKDTVDGFGKISAHSMQELPLLDDELPLPPPNQEAAGSAKRQLPCRATLTEVAQLQAGTAHADVPAVRVLLSEFAGATFPNKSPATTRRLAQLLRVLEEIYRSLCTGFDVTKRDIYYRAPQLFGKQSTVDRLVDKVSRTFTVTRSALGVTATAKGLIAGAGQILLTLGEAIPESGMLLPAHETAPVNRSLDQKGSVNLRHDRGVLIPDIALIDRMETPARWILVVEKDAVFTTLVQGGVTESRDTCCWLRHGCQIPRSTGIIITGKGYPDLNTREFLARVMNDNVAMHTYILVDADPYGLDIYEQYRKALGEKARHRCHLLGILMPDLEALGLLHSTQASAPHRPARPFPPSSSQTLALTPRDRSKIASMLRADKNLSLAREVQ